MTKRGLPRHVRRGRLVICGGTLLCSILIVAGFAWLVRSRGVSELEAVQREIATEGGWTTIAELSQAVDVDEGLQQEFRDWRERVVEAAVFADAQEFWVIQEFVVQRPGASIPPGINDALEASKELFREGIEFLRRPNLVLSSVGSNATELGVEEFMRESRAESALVSRSLDDFTDWLQIRSLSPDQDATVWLLLLDRLVDANAPSGSLLDAFFFARHCAARDKAYLAGIIHGAITDESASAWFNAPSVAFKRYAEGLRADRIVFWPRLLETSSATRREWMGIWWKIRSVLERDASPVAWDRVVSTTDWLTLPSDCARAIRSLYRLERRLEGDLSVDVSQVAVDCSSMSSVYGRILGPDIAGLSAAVLALDTSHRIIRLAGRIYLDRKTSGELPPDDASLAKRWPNLYSAPGDRLGIRYEKLSADQFRIAVDPRSPRRLASPEQIALWSKSDDPIDLKVEGGPLGGLEFSLRVSNPRVVRIAT